MAGGDPLTTTLVWFRLDLRLDDQPALHAALVRGGPVVPLFIWDPASEAPWSPGAASCWWLHQALARLESSLAAVGSRLIIRRGDTLRVLREVIAESGATAVVWNRRYEPAVIARDAAIKAELRGAGLEAMSYDGALLFEPWTIRTKTGKPYRVFTPFSRACRAAPSPARPLDAPARLPAPVEWPASVTLDSLQLQPTIPWDRTMRDTWSGEPRALFEEFLEQQLVRYVTGRDRPDQPGTSRMSPHLQVGTVSARRLWHDLDGLLHGHPDSAVRLAAEGFQRQLLWREFAYHLLFHEPATTEAPLRPEFARFPWRAEPRELAAWQRGRTGYPIVDAGMRQLWALGWMHNRVRMVVGSFLVKDLRHSWHEGARWFWDTLIDADLANNTMGWQWIAGCGADAAPYFRIFNPVTQGERFDPSGDYVRRWVPELAALPAKWIHQPWDAPAAVLHEGGVELGTTYPHPIVDHGIARREALEAYASLKS